jgi:hypothetical protein
MRVCRGKNRMKHRMSSSWFVLGLCLYVTWNSVHGQTLQTGLDRNLQSLAVEFFRWRATTQPASYDDIPRVERPDGWRPDVSPESLADQEKRYRDFRKRLDAISRRKWTLADSVDYLLLRSAIERVNWELNYLKAPFCNPDYYCHETLGIVYELLVIGSPMSESRMQNVIVRMESIPKTLQAARLNLKEAVLPFARMALANLADIRSRLDKTTSSLKNLCDKKFHVRLDKATQTAIRALEEYTGWLESRQSTMSAKFNVGRKAYVYYLKTIALIPFTPEQMLIMGRTEFNRAVAFESIEKNKNSTLPEPPLFKTIEEQIRQSELDEGAIRKFLEEKNILTVPSWVQHYRKRAIPSHIEPLSGMGVVDDLTSEQRLSEDAVSYIPPPSPNLPFFHKASAQDPRPIIIHEGVPGHFFQMVRSWKNPDPIRRHFFDSGPIEGIGFYVEEMLLQAGLFDQDRPQTREIIYRFMRLRALRVEADIRLALGNYTVEQAADYLASTVPMDRGTAIGEAAFFSNNPGQAITYQIGKLQIEEFMTEARTKLGTSFHLRDFHDYLMVNGNVPITLLGWEYLGLNEEVKKLW